MAQAMISARPRLVYVMDDNRWVVNEIGKEVLSYFRKTYLVGLDTRAASYRKTVLHFPTPDLILNKQRYRHIHSSNRLLMTWTHGLPDNPDPAIRRRISDVKEGAVYLEKIHVMNQTARTFLIDLGIDEHKIVLIPHGVHTQKYQPATPEQRIAIRATLGIPAEVICIGSFQKDSPGWDNTSMEPKWIKGPDVLADALIRLAKDVPIFVLLTSPSRRYLIDRLTAARIPFRHDVLSNADDLIPYFHALDLYMLTSRDEGGPLDFLKAMSSGVPVVSTRMGMPADVIDHGRNGMLAEIDDVAQLVSAARTLIDDAECRAQIGQAARETILSGYDWSTILEQYRELLYEPLL